MPQPRPWGSPTCKDFKTPSTPFVGDSRTRMRGCFGKLKMTAFGPEANSPARGRAGPVIGVLRPSAEAILEMLGYGSRLPWAPRPARHHPSLDDSVEP
jgi:hypothetical protein